VLRRPTRRLCRQKATTGRNPGMALPGEDSDPTRSPEDAFRRREWAGQPWSSSLSGVDTLLPQRVTVSPKRRKSCFSKRLRIRRAPRKT